MPIYLVHHDDIIYVTACVLGADGYMHALPQAARRSVCCLLRSSLLCMYVTCAVFAINSLRERGKIMFSHSIF